MIHGLTDGSTITTDGATHGTTADIGDDGMIHGDTGTIGDGTTRGITADIGDTIHGTRTTQDGTADSVLIGDIIMDMDRDSEAAAISRARHGMDHDMKRRRETTAYSAAAAIRPYAEESDRAAAPAVEPSALRVHREAASQLRNHPAEHQRHDRPSQDRAALYQQVPTSRPTDRRTAASRHTEDLQYHHRDSPEALQPRQEAAAVQAARAEA